MNGSAYNAWKWVSLSPLPGWALGALGVALLLGIVLAALGLRREPSPGRRAMLFCLRVLAGVALFLFLLEPGIRELQVAQLKGRIAVLVDRSASMNFPSSPGAKSRLAEVGDFLARAQGRLDALRERFDVEVLGYDGTLAPVTPRALQTEPARGPNTDLLAAVRAVRGGEGSSKPLSGVLLFSDGADNAELASGVDARAKAELTSLGVPISTFLAGKGGVVDLAVEQVKVDDFAFVRNTVTAIVELHARGLSGQEAAVVLRRENQVIGTKTVHLEGDDARVSVPFSFTPDQTGRFVYTVSAPVFPGEAVTENNSRSFVLKVIRDRIRVLYVVGRPSWDVRFLRGLLKQDPNIDLVSFYILRTNSNQTGVLDERRELSLIPFPMNEIFAEKLHTFDVVIFQNFGYSDPTLSISNYEENLERYVFNGGAFVEIGGDHAFGEGRTNFPVLGRALPVDPSGQGVAQGAFKPRLTASGLRHPVTALGNNAASSEALWASLPAVEGANLVKPKPGAAVLLDHPSANVEGQSAPILALWDYGRGRSMALMIDESWKWAFTAHAGGATTRLYDKLWANALRWLVRDPDLTTLRVTAEPPTVEPGKPVGAVVLARLPDYSPAQGAQVSVELVQGIDGKPIASARAVAGPDGIARVEFPPPPAGAYKLVAKADRNGQPLGQAEDAVAVASVGLERSDPAVRPDLLEQIAQASGGQAYVLPLDRLPEVPLVAPPTVEVGRAKDRPIWDRWYYLVALATLLGAEWFLRRRFGYV
jgi:uncharacterized membrane protein